MYDIKQLEDEWKRYRKKKLKPWYIGILSVILVSIPIVFFLMNKKIDFSELKGYFEISKETLSDEKMSDNSVEKKTKSLVLINSALDSLEIKDNIIAVVEKEVKKPVNILVDIPVLEEPSEAQVEDKGKVYLEIVESSSVTAYKDVERRFMESHEIDDALFLARSYYKKGDYEKSEYWALETNKLDENSKESLFIFVKSKVKQGRKNEAISILTAYIKETNSQEGKKLLYEIENNKL